MDQDYIALFGSGGLCEAGSRSRLLESWTTSADIPLILLSGLLYGFGTRL
jgi:hypothetical protein